MPHVELTRKQAFLHWLGQLQQAQEVGGRRTRTTHRVGGLLMTQTEFIDETLDAGRLFQWVEIFPLDVFDQRHGQRGLVRNLAHQYRHLTDTR